MLWYRSSGGGGQPIPPPPPPRRQQSPGDLPGATYTGRHLSYFTVTHGAGLYSKPYGGFLFRETIVLLHMLKSKPTCLNATVTII
jgi:hypothetical protein